MEFSSLIFIWLLLGIILMLAEIILPGGIVIFLGLACLVVASALALGIVHGLVQSMTLWFIASIVLLLSFRHITQRWVGGDSHVGNTDEELDIYHQTALVKVTIGPGQQQGRVEFKGSEWPALGDGSLIEAGSNVRVICRENIALVVEPIND
ncbi:NfeD family protein [Shewanella sp. AS1]|uniref:NfeD family protein n=1 Tax=Shewanella sp. AS1 TaxID=2907626 RepID=UPI001F452F1C|nr:NfeD family protein [Shewanella sp. AS1]MCE9679919.1 NfeD family protein [Shewanella sp. AS1]